MMRVVARSAMAAALLTALAQMPAQAQTPVVVQSTGLENVFVMAPIYVMKEQKFDLAQGVDLQIRMYANIEAVYQAMRAGDSEMAPGGWTNAVQWRATGAPWTVVYPLALGAGVDVLVPKDSPLKSLADLKGKKVASYAGPTGTATILFRTLLADHYGFDPEKSNLLQYGSPPVLINALKRGEIDALVMLDPLASRLMAGGDVRSISNLVADYEAKTGKKMLWLGWMVHDKLVKRDPQAITKILVAYNQALDYLDKNPDEWKKYAKPSGLEGSGLDLLVERTKRDLKADWNQRWIDDLNSFTVRASAVLGKDVFPPAVPPGTLTLDYVPKQK
jgi:ABC-type nitrate/sulfonate/bicarbonate transport system substrate-binding protein